MVPALVFQKVVISYHEMRCARIAFFVVGPPLRPATHPDSPPGRGAQMSQNLFKNILFDQISMCCWPRILAQIDPNRSFFTLVPPPCGQQHILIRLRGGGAQMSQNLFQKSLFERTSMCCWPRIVVKIAPNLSCLTFGPPPGGRVGCSGRVCRWVYSSRSRVGSSSDSEAYRIAGGTLA